jgi:GNAT superfamily N-acetyltransferase
MGGVWLGLLLISVCVRAMDRNVFGANELDVNQVISFAMKHHMTHSLDKVAHVACRYRFFSMLDWYFFGNRIFAQEDRRTIGVVIFDPNYISYLTVDEQYRNKGVARMLMLSACYFLVQHANKHTYTIRWHPAACGLGGLSQGRLVEFYKTFGAIKDESSNYKSLVLQRTFIDDTNNQS